MEKQAIIINPLVSDCVRTLLAGHEIKLDKPSAKTLEQYLFNYYRDIRYIKKSKKGAIHFIKQ